MDVVTYIVLGVILVVVCLIIIACYCFLPSNDEAVDNIDNNEEIDSTQINKKPSMLESVNKIYQSKRTQRLFLIASLATGIFDLFTDWSVTANFFIQSEYGWGATLTIFLLFHNIISLLYHRSEHNEKKEIAKARKLTNLKHTTSNNTSTSDIEQPSPKSDIQLSTDLDVTTPSKNKSKEFREDEWTKIVSEIEYDESNAAKLWQYPFFMIGMGAYAASYQCLLRGEQNQVYMENRYFEVLLESMPIGLVTIFAQLSLKDYNWIVLLSISTSAISVGCGTAVYFARSHKNGNPLEFRPIVTSSYLWILLGICTTCDYILRIYSPLLFIDALLKYDQDIWIIDNIWILMVVIPTFVVVMEVILIYFIHGDRNFSIGFGWLALYSSSVPYFAAVATRFNNYLSFWVEIVFRNLLNIFCVIMAVILNDNTWDENNKQKALTNVELKAYVYMLLGLFIIGNGLFVVLICNTKVSLDQLQVARSSSTFGRRAYDLDK